MADEKISELSPAGTLTGAELAPIVQGGETVRTSLADISSYANNLLSLNDFGFSANAETLIGHTFAQMRADLDLEPGTDFYSISAADAAIAAVISDTAYNATSWNGVTNVAPSKNTVRDQFEALSGLYQPLDANLTIWAGVTPSANGQSLVAAADYSAMRTLLGLVIGTNVQAYDAGLAWLDGLNFTNEATFKAGVNLEIGVDVQAYDADLTTWAGITPASGVATFLATPSSANLKAAITDETGSGGALVFATAPTINQPNIVGTTTNDSAAAGSVGEYVSSVIAQGSAVSLSTDTAANITSITLTAGDWDVWGKGQFSPNPGVTTVAYILCSISSTSAVLNESGDRVAAYSPGGADIPYIGYITVSPGPVRISVASTTTYYLVGQSGFGTSTMSAWGALLARRVR